MSQLIPILHRHRLVAAAMLGMVAAGSAWAQTSPTGGGAIYSCVDAQGRRLTSDRPIRECMDREQSILNSDGSTRRRIAPSMTPEERAAYDEAQRRKLADEVARKDAVRLDRNLLQRYQNETSHQRAREGALEQVRQLMASSQQRMADLQRERRTLDAESEFYAGKDLPRQLRSQFDANQAATEAQRSLISNYQAELERLNGVYDEELARLRRLWAGAAPGSGWSPAPSRTGTSGAH